MDIMVMLMFGYGIYVTYLHIKMKNTGEIPKALLSSKINLDRAKDIPGYIKFTFPIGIAFGIIVSLCSGIILARDYINSIIPAVAEIFLFVTIVIYAIIFLKAAKKYLV